MQRRRAHSFLLGHIVNRLSQVLDVTRRDTGDRDATVLGKVNMPVVLDGLDLHGIEPRETEHADLDADGKITERLSKEIYISDKAYDRDQCELTTNSLIHK